MALASGGHHVALVTQDMDRLIAFYERVFDAEVVLDLTEGPLRHVMIDVGGGFCLHPFQLPGENPNAVGGGEIFGRGHLDHVAIRVDAPQAFEEIRARLVADGASDGTVVDFGLVRTVGFTDPDGMECEIAIWVDAPARTFEDRGVEEYVTASA